MSRADQRIESVTKGNNSRISNPDKSIVSMKDSKMVGRSLVIHLIAVTDCRDQERGKGGGGGGGGGGKKGRCKQHVACGGCYWMSKLEAKPPFSLSCTFFVPLNP